MKFDRVRLMEFEVHVMDLVEDCTNKEEFEEMADLLHQSVETAIQDVCEDAGIKDYWPSY